MGNCLGFFYEFSTRSIANNNPSIRTSNNINNYSNTTIDVSTTSSSTVCKSPFSEAASQDEGNEVMNNPDGKILESSNLKEFTFADLKRATKNFKSDTYLGEGGWIDEKTYAPSDSLRGMVVAIKKLKSESEQGFAEWKVFSALNFNCLNNQESCIWTFNNRSVIKFPVFLEFVTNPLMEGEKNSGKASNSEHALVIRVSFRHMLGYCLEDKELLLVYEFMQKGSLENHLFRRNPNIDPLPWDIRLKIAIGAARGLAFLHTSEKQVIYRDFKASNILLDVNYNAKISDFGLAKSGPAGEESHVTTRIMGTYGYAAPEYIATGHLYVKSDVYGFGVVLLEIMSGQRAHNRNRPSAQQNLVEWLKPLLSQKKKLKNTVMDPRMEGQYSSKAMAQAAQLTLNCLNADPKSRPSMKEVVEVLEHIEAMKEKPKATKSTSGSSQPHRRRQGRT
uniref:Protein kinase domain-containing protein n=1 Tax=Salix viminalis TaxID=40686 RepID=A0A6N2LNY6_SALVM